MATDSSGTVGENITYSLRGSKLILEIDISKDCGESNSGKSLMVASSKGNKKIAGLMLGLNCYRYKKGKGK